jgi:pyruvate kinase
MLSGETAAGRYPLESVLMMDRIIREAEANATESLRPAHIGDLLISETIAEAICHAAEELKMKAIAVFTETGGSARLVSKYRPRAAIIAFSPNQDTRRKMSLFWGVLPRSINRVHDIDKLAKTAERRLKQENLVKDGDIVGVIAGTPLGTRGSTNLMRLVRIGC